MTRHHYTRWELNHLGKLALRSASFEELPPSSEPAPVLLLEASQWLAGVGLGTTLLVLVALMLSLGCAQEPDPMTDGPSAEWCLTHQCQAEAVTYTAVGEGVYRILAPALKRYQRATGRSDLWLDPQAGIPVMFREDLSTDGKIDCANTTTTGRNGWWRTQKIEIDPTPPEGCPDPGVSLLHELIHAMHPSAQHVEDEASLFTANASTGYDQIDEAALERLCEGFACETFQPERSRGN